MEEIWRGLRPGEEPHARRLFSGLRVAPLGVAEGIRAGGLAAGFRRQGRDAPSSRLLDRRGRGEPRRDTGDPKRRKRIILATRIYEEDSAVAET